VLLFHGRDWVVVLIYQADLALVFGMGPLKMLHAWSLAIEERFYLLWPLALLGLLALKNLRIALTVLLTSVLLAGLWRMAALQFWMRVAARLITVSTCASVGYYSAPAWVSGSAGTGAPIATALADAGLAGIASGWSI